MNYSEQKKRNKQKNPKTVAAFTKCNDKLNLCFY